MPPTITKRTRKSQILRLLNEEIFIDWLKRHSNQNKIIAEPRQSDGSAVFHFLQAYMKDLAIHVNNVIVWESTQHITVDDSPPLYLYLPEWAVCITARTNQFCKGFNKATVKEILWLNSLCQEPYVWDDVIDDMPLEVFEWEV